MCRSFRTFACMEYYGYIYKILSPSGRIYIGQTNNIERRWNQYKYYYDNINHRSLIYRSLKKYGYDAHTFEIIEQCNLSDLSNRERYWIEFYKSLYSKYPECKGLNLHEGGNKPPSRKLGTKMSAEFCRNISDKQKLNHKNNPNMGMKGKRNKRAKKILDLSTNIIYHGYDEAAKAFNVGRTTIVRRLAKKNSNLVII